MNSVINPQIMFKYQQLIKENLSEIAKLITIEQVYQDTPAFELKPKYLLSVPSQCNLYLGQVLCISDLSCRVRHTKMQKETWWEASRWKFPNHINVGLFGTHPWARFPGGGITVCKHNLDVGRDLDWYQQGHGSNQPQVATIWRLVILVFQGASWCLCRHCPFQLPGNDSPLDVSHRPCYRQHLYYEGYLKPPYSHVKQSHHHNTYCILMPA